MLYILSVATGMVFFYKSKDPKEKYEQSFGQNKHRRYSLIVLCHGSVTLHTIIRTTKL